MAQSRDPGGFQPIEVPVIDHTATAAFRPIEVQPPGSPAPSRRPSRPRTSAAQTEPTAPPEAPAKKKES